MHGHRAVVDLAPIAVPLPTCSHRLVAALGRSGLVHATDRVRVGVLRGNDLLAPISEFLFMPLDRFQKALQRSRRRLEP
jgi:hypothetical protein